MVSQRFADLGRFEFLVRPASGEGDLTGRLRRISIANIDAGFYPHEAVVAQARQGLVKESGEPVERLLAEIEGRREPPPVAVSSSKRASPRPATADQSDGLYGA